MISCVGSLKSAAIGLSDEDTKKLVVDGIDKVLGDGAAHLIMKTLKLLYHEDILSFPLQVDCFEELVKKLIGETASQAIITEIISEIKIFKSRNNKNRIKN